MKDMEWLHRWTWPLETVHALCAGHTDSVEAVALSAALPVAATASIDGKVLIWDNATLSVRGTCEHPEVISQYRLGPLLLAKHA